MCLSLIGVIFDVAGIRKPDLRGMGARGLGAWQGVTKMEDTMTRFGDSVIGYVVIIFLLVATVLVAWMRYYAVLEIFKQRYTCGGLAGAGREEMGWDAQV